MGIIDHLHGPSLENNVMVIKDMNNTKYAIETQWLVDNKKKKKKQCLAQALQ